MSVSEARAMIDCPELPGRPSQWADFGCGTGTFTMALAELLAPGSLIHAIDYNPADLVGIPGQHRSVDIQKHTIDFMKDELRVELLDGILMANSLHYVKDKVPFLQRITQQLNDQGLLLIVEYDTTRANPWIPYPLSFENLAVLAPRCGFHHIRKLGDRPSVYNPAPLFSAVIYH